MAENSTHGAAACAQQLAGHCPVSMGHENGGTEASWCKAKSGRVCSLQGRRTISGLCKEAQPGLRLQQLPLEL
jgi:hypothetical protein